MKTNSEIQTNSPKVFNSEIAEKALKKFFDNMSIKSAIVDVEVIEVSFMESEDYTSKEALHYLWTVKQLKKLLKKLDKSFDVKAYYALRKAKANV